MLNEAIRFAVDQHYGTYREGPDPLPYICHPMEVLANLREVAGETDQDSLCAAVLHDVIEEGNTDQSDLSKRFGDRVAGLVQALTREEPAPAALEGLSREDVWQLRADMLLAEIAKMKPEVQKIKLADRLSNIRGAYRTKKGKKLERYVWQTKRILKVVPRPVCPPLWDAITNEMKSR